MTEEELIKRAQSGDNKAIETLLNDHKQLVNYVTRKYFLIGGDSDDLLQEGMIALYKAINTFDFNKNVSFSSFAKLMFPVASCVIVEEPTFTTILCFALKHFLISSIIILDSCHILM